MSRLVDVHDDEGYTPCSADHEVLLLRCRHPQSASGPMFEVVAAEVRPLDEEAHCEHVPYWDKTGSLFNIPRFHDADDVAASEQSTRFVGSITIQELVQGVAEARRPAIEAKLAIQSFCYFVDSTRVEYDSAVFFQPDQLGIQYYPTVFFGAILEGIAVLSDGKILVASHETKSLLGKPWRAIEFKTIRKTDLIVELARALMLFTFITLSFAIIWLPVSCMQPGFAWYMTTNSLPLGRPYWTMRRYLLFRDLQRGKRRANVEQRA